MSDECYSLLLVIYLFCFCFGVFDSLHAEKVPNALLWRLLHFPANYRYALHQGTFKVHELLKDDLESVLASLENTNFK